MSNKFLEAQELFNQNELERSLELLDRVLENDVREPNALLLRGKVYYRMQRWGEAMNDFAEVIELQPENQDATTGIEMARSILGYFTPDMFNP